MSVCPSNELHATFQQFAKKAISGLICIFGPTEQHGDYTRGVISCVFNTDILLNCYIV